jgi:hypothetical protein
MSSIGTRNRRQLDAPGEFRRLDALHPPFSTARKFANAINMAALRRSQTLQLNR